MPAWIGEMVCAPKSKQLAVWYNQRENGEMYSENTHKSKIEKQTT